MLGTHLKCEDLYLGMYRGSDNQIGAEHSPGGHVFITSP